MVSVSWNWSHKLTPDCSGLHVVATDYMHVVTTGYMHVVTPGYM